MLLCHIFDVKVTDDRVNISLQRRGPLSTMFWVAPLITVRLNIGCSSLLERLFAELLLSQLACGVLPSSDGVDTSSDFVASRVWSVALVTTGGGEVRADNPIDHSAELGAGASSPASFAEDTSGELYVLGYGGTIHRIDGPGGPPPSAPAPIRPHTGSPTGTARPRP